MGKPPGDKGSLFFKMLGEVAIARAHLMFNSLVVKELYQEVGDQEF